MTSDTALDELIPYLMNRVVARLNQALAKALKRRKVTFQEWRVLAVLAAHDGLTVSPLAVATVVPQSTLSRVIERMERAHLVIRRGSPEDYRRVEVWLTERGRAVYDDILPLAVGEYRRAVAGFPPQQVAELRAMLQTMWRNLAIEPVAEKPAAEPAAAAHRPSRVV